MKNFINNYIINFLKGMLLGFVCVATPGVSGGTIIVIIGLFNKIIESGNDLLKGWFSKKWWKTVLFFIFLVVGGIIGAYIGSKVVTITYDKYPLATTICLMGLIIGSLFMLFDNVKIEIKKKSSIIIFAIVFIASLAYTFLLAPSSVNPLENMSLGKYIILVLLGIFTVATMIIPGISGNIVLMAFGYYYPITNILSNITTLELSYSLPILGTYTLGCVIGAFLIIKILKILLEKFEGPTNVAILAFVVASPIIMVKICLLNNETFVFNWIELIIGIVLAAISFTISYIISKISIKNKNREEKEHNN